MFCKRIHHYTAAQLCWVRAQPRLVAMLRRFGYGAALEAGAASAAAAGLKADPLPEGLGAEGWLLPRAPQRAERDGEAEGVEGAEGAERVEGFVCNRGCGLRPATREDPFARGFKWLAAVKDVRVQQR